MGRGGSSPSSARFRRRASCSRRINSRKAGVCTISFSISISAARQGCLRQFCGLERGKFHPEKKPPLPLRAFSLRLARWTEHNLQEIDVFSQMCCVYNQNLPSFLVLTATGYSLQFTPTVRAPARMRGKQKKMSTEVSQMTPDRDYRGNTGWRPLSLSVKNITDGAAPFGASHPPGKFLPNMTGVRPGGRPNRQDARWALGNDGSTGGGRCSA